MPVLMRLGEQPRLRRGFGPVCETQEQPFQLSVNACVKVDFQRSRVTADAGLILVRGLDERLGLSPAQPAALSVHDFLLAGRWGGTRAKTSRYPFSWIKVKSPNYSQAIGRGEMFNRLLSEFNRRRKRPRHH